MFVYDLNVCWIAYIFIHRRLICYNDGDDKYENTSKYLNNGNTDIYNYFKMDDGALVSFLKDVCLGLKCVLEQENVVEVTSRAWRCRKARCPASIGYYVLAQN